MDPMIMESATVAQKDRPDRSVDTDEIATSSDEKVISVDKIRVVVPEDGLIAHRESVQGGADDEVRACEAGAAETVGISDDAGWQGEKPYKPEYNCGFFHDLIGSYCLIAPRFQEAEFKSLFANETRRAGFYSFHGRRREPRFDKNV